MKTIIAKQATLVAVIGALAIAAPAGAQEISAWWPRSGAVVLSGGAMSRATNDVFVKRLIDLAGGPDSMMVIIPTANPRFDADALRRNFESRGAHRVVVLDAPTSTAANSDESVRILHSARVVFMTGGEPMRLENAYRGTRIERELKAVLDRGGVLAGDSAGATAIGCAFLTWLPDPFGKRGEEFNVLPRVAVSPHADQARGYSVDAEVLKYLLSHPSTIGIDLDHDTLLILRGGSAEVIGTGGVSIIDVSKSRTAPSLRLTRGGRVDLAK